MFDEKDSTYSPPQVGYALTISAILEPRVKHIDAPRIQHHATYSVRLTRISGGNSYGAPTEAGPPSRRGVLNVVAILEHNPCQGSLSGQCHVKVKVGAQIPHHDAERKTDLKEDQILSANGRA